MKMLFASLVLIIIAAAPWPSFAAAPGATRMQPPTDILAGLKFRNLGPSVAGGRVSAIAGIPGDPLIYYVGTAGGGVWKTTNGGNTWSAIFTKQATASIGAIAVAPSNPELVWVGTGEANIRNDVIDGAGIYFSPDGGHSWRLMGLKDAGQISDVCIDPRNPKVVYVGVLGHAWGPNATRGVFRTTDGGKTWMKVLFVDDSTGVASLAMQPGNPEVLFAAMWQARRYPWQMINGGPNSGIYRSTDGGDTWTKLTKGLPKPPLGRIALAIAPSNPNHIYALIASSEGMLWQSTDLGDNWTKVSDHHSLDVRPFYFSRMEVSPDNENKIFFCSLMLMESDDGGRTARPADRGVHVDHHAIWIDPENPNRIAEGTDGDFYVSTDGAKTWRTFDNLPIEQFYQVAAGSDTPYTLCGGLQDNNAWCGPSSSLGGTVNGADWRVVAGGDGEYAVPAPSDSSIIYADSQNADLDRLDTKTHESRFIRPYLPGVEQVTPSDLKYRFNWTSPIAVSPADANVVYLGGNVVFKTTDGGAHWTPISPDLTRNDRSKQAVAGTPIEHDISGAETYDTILALTLAPSDPRVIWVGTDDGLVQVTRDDGKNWSNVTPRGAPEWARVSQVGVSPFNPATAYVAFDAHELDDNRPYVYKTTDCGRSWEPITAGLPDDVPVHVVREDPNHQGLLVLGSDTGLFYSLDSGAHWRPLKSNFPTAPVYDLKFVKRTHDLVVATHGRGLFVLDDIRPIEQLNPAVESAEFHLFQSGPGVMYRRWAGVGGPEAGLTVPNAPQGVVIDYELKTAIASHGRPEAAGRQSGGVAAGSAGGAIAGARPGAARGPVKIVITDSHGREVSTLHGPGAAGINRVEWLMRYDGPAQYRPAVPMGAGQEGGFRRRGLGPRVVPGTYHIAVTAGGNTQTETVAVEADPSAGASLADLRAQTEAALLARNELSALDEMLTRIDAISGEISSFANAIDGSDEQSAKAKFSPLLGQGRALNRKLQALKASVYEVHVQRDAGEDSLHYLELLRSQLSSLQFGIEGYYGHPPNALIQGEMSDLRGHLDQALGEFNHLLKADVANYNRVARDLGAPTVYAGAPITVVAPPSD